MVQRTTMGANQEMEPSGDVAYVTCGPFACQDGMDAPEISIANSTVCSDFDPSVSLQVGYVDNDGLKVQPSDYTVSDTASNNTLTNDGVDVGWETDSNVAMTVKHHFSGVARGVNFTATGVDAAKGSKKALAMTNFVAGTTPTAATINDADFKGALLVGSLAGADTSTNPATNACATTPYTSPIAGLHKPDSCFRVVTAGTAKAGINNLGGYSIELAAKDSGVSWGKVAWDPDPFKDLKCESVTFMATDEWKRTCATSSRTKWTRRWPRCGADPRERRSPS